jgi:hypothetical protein
MIVGQHGGNGDERPRRRHNQRFADRFVRFVRQARPEATSSSDCATLVQPAGCLSFQSTLAKKLKNRTSILWVTNHDSFFCRPDSGNRRILDRFVYIFFDRVA